ncbi:MAG: sigma-70 family RNA polymerase sigma factor [Ruminococcaceae bacterium]|nr:sigma-70 family RNA polymerase sigma factor [Oscillospiraceae bacterium]
MDDERIISLYWDRNEEAIPATAAKYGSFCDAIANNILGNRLDAEECVNDTYLKTWNAIPPHRPCVLSAFLGKIVRNLSLNRYKYNTAAKRGGGELPVVLDELGELVSGSGELESELERQELVMAINGFLYSLSPEKRGMLVCRYWYSDSVASIALRFGMSEGAVTMALKRLRKRMYTYLSERGVKL